MYSIAHQNLHERKRPTEQEKNKKIIISKSIGEYETILENFKFVRPHHSFLVNQEHIKSFSKNDGALLLMSNGIEIPVSQRKKDKFFGLLMSE